MIRAAAGNVWRWLRRGYWLAADRPLGRKGPL